MHTDKSIPLAEAVPGMVYRISSMEEHPITTRLLSMGIRPGANVIVVRTAAFGQTLYLKTERQQFGIRRDEAQRIWVFSEM